MIKVEEKSFVFYDSHFLKRTKRLANRCHGRAY